MIILPKQLISIFYIASAMAISFPQPLQVVHSYMIMNFDLSLYTTIISITARASRQKDRLCSFSILIW